MTHAADLPIPTAQSGLTKYLRRIRRFPMLEPQEEYRLAKRWRERGESDAAHRLVTSHLRLVPGSPWATAVMVCDRRGRLGRKCGTHAGGQALRAGAGIPARHLCNVVDQGGDPAIHPALMVAGQDGTTANQKRLFFNLRKAKTKISAFEDGDMHPDQVELIAIASASPKRRSLP